MAVKSYDLAKTFPVTKDCKELETQINDLIINAHFWSQVPDEDELNATNQLLKLRQAMFANFKCEGVIGTQNLGFVDILTKKYGAINQDRIVSDSISQRNKRLIIGTGILLIALAIVIVNTED